MHTLFTNITVHTHNSISTLHKYSACTHYIPTLCAHQQIFSALGQFSMHTPCAPILCVHHNLCTVRYQILVCSLANPLMHVPPILHRVAPNFSAHTRTLLFSVHHHLCITHRQILVHTPTHHYFSCITISTPRNAQF